MSSETTITDSDEGKMVVDSNGNSIGRVVEVIGDQAHVDPDPSVTDSIMTKLGWGSRDEETFPLQSDRVASITDDEIRLESM